MVWVVWLGRNLYVHTCTKNMKIKKKHVRVKIWSGGLIRTKLVCTYMHTYVRACMHTHMHTYIRITRMHTYIRITRMHTYIRIYVLHTCIRIYVLHTELQYKYASEDDDVGGLWLGRLRHHQQRLQRVHGVLQVCC
jgi:hypothetical protein